MEAGGDYSAFAGSSDLNYGEVFVGGATENLSARIYYSPRYFGQSSHAVYGELNATQPLDRDASACICTPDSCATAMTTRMDSCTVSSPRRT